VVDVSGPVGTLTETAGALVSTGGAVTVHEKPSESLSAPSVTVAVTENVPTVVGVPPMFPKLVIESPGGRPKALKVSEEPSGSLADSCKDTGLPLTVVRDPGFESVGA
jgi:hypothetical protein